MMSKSAASHDACWCMVHVLASVMEIQSPLDIYRCNISWGGNWGEKKTIAKE